MDQLAGWMGGQIDERMSKSVISLSSCLYYELSRPQGVTSKDMRAQVRSNLVATEVDLGGRRKLTPSFTNTGHGNRNNP